MDEVISLGVQRRELQLRAGTFDATERTVDVVWTTGARRKMVTFARGLVDEELAVEPAAVRLERLNGGAPVLNSHNGHELKDQIGVVVPGSARIEDGLGVATLKLSGRASLAEIVADIGAGIIRNISVGYVVHRYEITEAEGAPALMRATDWEPYEISFVPIPADAGAQARGDDPAQDRMPCTLGRAAAPTTETVMDTTTETAATAATPAAVTAPAARVGTVNIAAIRAAVSAAKLGDDFAFDVIARHEAEPLTRTALMAAIGEKWTAEDAPARTSSRITVTRDEGDTRRDAMGDALLARMNPRHKLTEAARQFRGLSLARIAEDHLALEGVSVRGLTAGEIAERSLHTGSDFPNLVGGALNRRLRQAYEENSPTYRAWARRAPNFPDFRATDIVQLSALPDMLRTNESGEFRYATMSDGKVSYSLLTYGVIVGLTRQLIINDDLRALERMMTGFAGSAARLENRLVYGVLTGAGTYNGGNLFTAGQGNLAGVGAAITVPSLSAARGAMRLQKGLQNEELNIAPRFLLVPTAQEQIAYQFTSEQFVPAMPGGVNEFRAGGRTALVPIVDPVLDALSPTAWYLLGDSAQVDTVEYAYLDGFEGVQLSNRIGFNVDGVEFKAVLDFGAAAIDYRGVYRNPGA